jgi:hypothetical protein
LVFGLGGQQLVLHLGLHGLLGQGCNFDCRVLAAGGPLTSLLAQLL